MEGRTTEEGLLRAFALLVQQNSSREIKQKTIYRQFGSGVHASRRLTKAESASVDALIAKLKKLDPRDDKHNPEIELLLKELSKLPVKFVPIKQERRIDTSKTYPYASKRQGY